MATVARLDASPKEGAGGRVNIAVNGTVEEVDGRAGATLIERYPALEEYARALLTANRDTVRFLWIAPDSALWYAVRIDIDSMGTEPRGLHLAAHAVTPPFKLTPRELDVLTLLAGGIANREIARLLGAAVRTVTTHVERILVKLDQTSRAGAASVAVDLGLLRLPVPGGGRAIAALTVGLVDIASASHPPDSHRAPRVPKRRPVLLGTFVPLTSVGHEDGRQMLNGTELAVAEINSRGGVSGKPIELRIVDSDILSPDAVRRAFAELAALEVDAVTSGYTATQTDTDDLAAEYGAPYLHAGTREVAVQRVREDPTRYRNIFHVCPTDMHYGPGFIRFLEELSATRRWRPRRRRLAVITTGFAEVDVGIDALARLAEQHGWHVAVAEFGLPIGVSNWEPLVARLERAEVDALFLGDFFPEGEAAFLRTFLRRPTDMLVYALYGPSVPWFTRTVGAAADGVIWATVSGSYADDIGRRFAARYRRTFGEGPGRSHAGIAYDRVNMLAAAWARAENPRAFDRIGQELRRVVHRGVNGAYYLDNPGQCGLAFPDTTSDPSIASAHLVLQIQRGRHRILSPAPYTESTFELPPWFSPR